MDIRNLRYFVKIVDLQCNISAAAGKLNISQPALSTIIKNLEASNNVNLFERYNGRLQNLTPSGEIFYKNAVEIIEHYSDMISELRESSLQYKGQIKIGIPPLILGIQFADILPSLILGNPDIKFEVFEIGAFGLKKLLISKSLDFAVLLSPIDISPGTTKQHLLISSELSAFMSCENPLSQVDILEWEMLDGKDIAIFDDTFMIHHHLKDKFRTVGIHPKIHFVSANWDYLMLSTKKTQLVTLLPSSLGQTFEVSGVVERPLRDPIPWEVVLHQPKKNRHSHIEKYVLGELLRHFGC